MARTLILFLIIFIEGYIVLSTELLAIRLLVPFTGSGTDTISIIIAAVLMPLAFGYYTGGKFKTRENSTYIKTVRNKLLLNLMLASLFLTFALSYPFLVIFFDFLYDLEITNRLITSAIYAGLFLVYPVYLLGQTIPLISNYFSRDRLPILTGKILFFSTLGSFMGAVFCTLILMTFLGVNYSVIITIGLISALALILSKSLLSKELLVTLCAFGIALWLNSAQKLEQYDIVENNSYNTIQIKTFGNDRIFKVNHNTSSGYNVHTGEDSFPHHHYIEQLFLDPVMLRSAKPIDILVLGAAGFGFGSHDSKNHYTFVDIDKDVKKAAEEHFLGKELGENKTFEPVSARGFLRQNKKKYDLIYVDLFRGPSLIPEHLVTAEFYQDIKKTLKPKGIFISNNALSPNFSDQYSINLDNTIRYVFKNVSRHVFKPYNGWGEGQQNNVLYIYYNHTDGSGSIYSDNKNTAVFDKP